MAKADPSPVKGRKRYLNVIYFIDSARTRSITVPLGRLNVLLVLLVLLVCWSAASAVLLVRLTKTGQEQAARLRTALQTIFEYEARDDKVFDLAYPPAARTAPGAVAEDAPLEVKAEAAAKAATALLGGDSLAGDEEGTPEKASLTAVKAPSAQTAAAERQAKRPAAEAPQVTAVVAPAAAPSAAAADSGVKNALAVTVANPVVKARAKALELRFDLASKSGSDRVEGLIWAVAEFQTDSGKKLFIGAPSGIQVGADGEPASPHHSSQFAIRRFKEKSFSFPFPSGETGTFVGVRIGIMDRAGAGKTTFDVPVHIHVGEG